MTRVSIDDQLREQERLDREARLARDAKPRTASSDLFKLQLEGLISVLTVGDPIRQKLQEALVMHNARHT